MKKEIITNVKRERNSFFHGMLHQRFIRKNDKVLFVFLLIFSVLLFSYSGMTVSAAPSVKFVSYTVNNKPEKISFVDDSVTVLGWGMTYDFDILGWESDKSDNAWEETTITGKGVSVAKGREGKATFTTSNNPTSGTRKAGTVTIKSPGGDYSFTVNQKVITYTISYSANGGAGAPANQSKRHTVNITLSSVKPIREGYVFSGWAASPAAKKIAYKSGQSYKTNKSLSLYAVWTPKKVTITWDSNGGSAVNASSNKIVGDPIGDLPSTKRDGCIFNGWRAGAGGTGSKISSTTSVPVRNTTYYADWTLKSEQSSSSNKLSVDKALLEFSHSKNAEKNCNRKRVR